MAAGLPGEDRVERHTRELIAYVRSQFPMRFYTGENWTTLLAAAAVLRLADMADAVLAHMQSRRDLDALTALRSMYELSVTVCWVWADPERRGSQWTGDAQAEQLKLHNDLASFGETLLTETEVQAAAGAPQLPPLPQRASEADDYWVPRIPGLHAGSHLLSFRGLYATIYRHASQATHGSVASLGPYTEQQARRFEIRRPAPEPGSLPYALVSPLLSMVLTVVGSGVTWIDEDRVRELNDLACADGPTQEGGSSPSS